MSHPCPDCGETCYCHGDIDDAEFDAPSNCSHICAGSDDGDDCYPEDLEGTTCLSCGKLVAYHCDGWGRSLPCVESIGETIAFHDAEDSNAV